jgi:hypothetical protein
MSYIVFVDPVILSSAALDAALAADRLSVHGFRT